MWQELEDCLYTCHISPLHTRSAGFGVQVPTADIPSGDAQVALILPTGIKRSSHLKTIWAPPVLMLGKFSMIPFLGAWGTPQLTGGRKLIEILIHCVGVRGNQIFTLAMNQTMALHFTTATLLHLCCKIIEDLISKVVC